MEISKFVRFNEYLSLVSLRLLMVYPNTRLSWFTRQLDLELMFTSTISLRISLLDSDIDILAVQESKLRKTNKTPSIEGYTTIRKDRNNILGGGLLLFIRTDIVFEKLNSFEKAGMEIQSIRIKVTKSSWLDLYNVYLPNTATQHTSFDPSLIKPGPSSIFLFDLNGHSQMWDPIQPQD